MPNRLMITSFVGVALALVACSGERKSPSRPPPAWLSFVTVKVERTRPAFDNHTEVFVALANQGQEPIEIRDLAADGAVRLAHAGGIAALHPVSVGVKKPIRLRPGQVTQTSLLFEATPGAPRALQLYDTSVPVPQ